MCAARRLHNGGNVRKVQVDHYVLGEAHQLGNRGDGLLQHIVRNAESVGKGDLLIGDVFQPVIGNDDQGIHLFTQIGNALLSLAHPIGALKLKGLGDHADGEDTGLMGQVRHNGRRAGAGAAAHTGGDEHHVGALQHLGNGSAALLGGLLADLGLGAGAHAVGQLFADLNLVFTDGLVQILLIGVHGNEFHAVHAGLNHTIDNVVTSAANTDHLDLDDTLL